MAANYRFWWHKFPTDQTDWGGVNRLIISKLLITLCIQKKRVEHFYKAKKNDSWKCEENLKERLKKNWAGDFFKIKADKIPKYMFLNRPILFLTESLICFELIHWIKILPFLRKSWCSFHRAWQNFHQTTCVFN